MYRNERENEIMTILNDVGYATVEYLSKKLHISASSIRRDLASLEQRGMVQRSYGGVEIADSVNRSIPFAMRSHENRQEKKRIATAAAQLVGEGDVVFVDGSSSGFYLCRELVGIKGITIITNSIDSLYFLTSFGVKTVSTGGVISDENRSVLVGDGALSTIDDIHADIVFFSAAGLDENGEVMDCYMSEVPIRRHMLAHAKKRVLLCDGNKVGKTSVYRQCNLCDVQFVVSDADLRAGYADKFPQVTFLQTE